jgi:hypothetical protein
VKLGSWEVCREVRVEELLVQVSHAILQLFDRLHLDASAGEAIHNNTTVIQRVNRAISGTVLGPGYYWPACQDYHTRYTIHLVKLVCSPKLVVRAKQSGEQGINDVTVVDQGGRVLGLLRLWALGQRCMSNS